MPYGTAKPCAEVTSFGSVGRLLFFSFVWAHEPKDPARPFKMEGQGTGKPCLSPFSYGPLSRKTPGFPFLCCFLFCFLIRAHEENRVGEAGLQVVGREVLNLERGTAKMADFGLSCAGSPRERRSLWLGFCIGGGLKKSKAFLLLGVPCKTTSFIVCCWETFCILLIVVQWEIATFCHIYAPLPTSTKSKGVPSQKKTKQTHVLWPRESMTTGFLFQGLMEVFKGKPRGNQPKGSKEGN